jgi:hypothetical protein
MRPPTPETAILHAIRLALGSEPDLVLWHLVQGAALSPHGGFVKYGLAPGAADLVGILDGRFFALETKAPRGRASDEQKLWGALVQRTGGFYCMVKSVDEAKQALERARRGETR